MPSWKWIRRASVVLLLAAVSLNGLSLAWGQSDAVLRASELFTVIVGSFALGLAWAGRAVARDLAKFQRQAGRLPAKVFFECDDDGAVAYVTTLDGNPIVLRVPEEVFAGGTQASMVWVINELSEQAAGEP